ncbi:AraC family transcriptional regulator [Actinomadura darangshiensis]|uniref:AraC family transcriptional regulator n=1 Tax=Actinomadura darangshiensis TaxID=705336 RepID=A0A4R5A3J0_9ACTN|nr:AraC family transcriptional regulator [Actinomadura darangshiensis]TDD65580.1 AraC family transcriptional regulator [Actinomadura darangshiensis]
MRESTTVAETDDFAVHAVRCAEHGPGWSEPEPFTGHQVVLVRAGRFRMRSRHGRVVIDRTLGYAQAADEEGQFAHPAGGDVCTAITLSPSLWRRPSGTVRVGARADVAHRLLLRAGPDVTYEAAERLLSLLVHLALDEPGGRRRALVDEAREAITGRHPQAAGLISLARLLEVSPSHLSRTFQRETGMSVTRYRNRIRVARALDRIEQGERDLSGLAADLGFADHAHLTRTVKAETGRPPAALRRLLGQS